MASRATALSSYVYKKMAEICGIPHTSAIFNHSLNTGPAQVPFHCHHHSMSRMPRGSTPKTGRGIRIDASGHGRSCVRP